VEGSLDLNGTRMIVHPERIGNIPDTWEQLKPTLDDAMLATYAHLQSPLKRELTLSDREDRSLQYHDLDLIRVENLKKMYGNFCAVSPLNFTVKRGEIFGLLGPNGSGKSTTFKMLCGLETPTSGNAYILGKSISPLDINTRMKIGYMPQKFSLYRLLSVKENLDFFGKMYNVSSKTLQHRIIELTDLLDLKEHINKPAGSLSLGLQQRLSFCCALLHYPEIVFLDEPTSGVDPMTRKDFWKLLLGLANHNITMIVTTHFLDEAQYCDRALMLLSGSPIALGSPSDLIQQAKKFQNQVHSMEDVFLAHLNHYEKMEHA
ncbi:MAG: ABC transporter ATP-binding protein, partial [Gammaproteobacteria bacterium]|nr:ABC transporter ATP-binding protein [Gammaproteobacteria bacterium]